MKEINEGEFASIFPDIALFLDKMVHGDKYKKAIRGYLNWRRTNPSQGLRGIAKFAKMTGLRAKDLDIVLHKLIKQGKLPKHLAIHENERKDSEIMMAEKKKFKDIRKDDPCWDGYKQVGMKKKNGKEVPNCVPEETEITEMKLPISDEMFKSLKKGDKIKINFDSSIKKGNENTYVVKSKSKSAKYNLEKIALKNVANPVAQASYLYNRQGKVTMAQGDMAVTMNSVVKEAVSALGDYQANLNPDSSKPLGGKIVRAHLVKPYKNRKHASRWMGVVDDFDDAVKKYPRKAVRELGKKDQWGNKIVQIWENENIELEAANLLDEGMSSSQIAQLKKAYGSIDRINVTGPAYKKAKAFIANMSKDELMDIAKAKVKWLSQFAASELAKSHDVKLKAKDYMESVSFSDFRENLEEAKTGLPTGQSTVDEAEELDEKAVSKSQQKFFGMVRAKQKGEMDDASPEVKKAADSMSKKDVKDFASTKHKGLPEEVELDEAIDFRKAFMDIQSYAKKSGGMDKTDFEKVAYYVKAIGDNQNTPNVANKAFMAMKKHIDGLDTDVRDGIHVLLKKHGMVKNGRLVQEGVDMKTFKDLRESKYAVDIEGLPKFYMDSDSPGKVKMTLRKLLKNPSTLNDVHRVPEGEVKSDFRKRAAGKEEVEESFDDNLEKRAIAVAKKMSDNMTGAVKEIEKIKKGLSKRPAVKKALQLYNEGVDSEFEHQLEESDNKKLAKVIKLMDSTESSSEAIKIVAKQMTNGNTAAAKKLITQALKADLGEAKKLDPVGKADADIDNDGDVDKSDEYLHKRRKAVKKAIKKTTKKKSGEAEEESKQSSQKLSGKQEKITISPKTDSE